MKSMSERWENIPGFERYQVSDHGRVRNGRTGRILRPGARNGYQSVSLSREGRGHTFTIHRLVATAFIPNPNGLPYVLHGDDNPSNNHFKNLRWGNALDNARDRSSRGRSFKQNWTHCKNGHEFTTKNTYIRPDGHRQCRSCTANRHADRIRRGLPEGDSRHGTKTGYFTWGCRCAGCRSSRKQS